MKRKIAILVLLLFVLSAGIFIGCNTTTQPWEGTYYASSGTKGVPGVGIIIEGDKIYIEGQKEGYTYNISGENLTLSDGTKGHIVEDYKILYFDNYLLFSYGIGYNESSINTRNGYFDSPLIMHSANSYYIYYFYDNGTFSYYIDGSAEIIFGTYTLNNGVLIKKSGNNPNDLQDFWYIDNNYNIYRHAFIKDYNLEQFMSTSSTNTPPSQEQTSYILTYSAGDGGYISGTTSQTVKEGANGQPVTAVANDGYEFLCWSDGVQTASRTDINVNSNITVTAYFKEVGNSGGQYDKDDFAHRDEEHLKLDIDEVCPTCGLECYDIKNGGLSILMYDRENETLTAEYYGEIAGSEFATYGRFINDIYLSSNVKTIGDRAFTGYAVANVHIADDSLITAIGVEAFSQCRSLTEIDLEKCHLLTTIEDRAFESSALSAFTIPQSVTKVGTYAFHYTNWYYNQPDGLIYLQHVAYEYNGTMPFDTQFEIKEGTIVIADCCFCVGASLRSITLPKSLKYIGYAAFSGCSALRNIVLPSNLISIGDEAFSGCSGLTNFEIYSNVKSIGNSAFAYCNNLKYNEYNDGLYLGNSNEPCVVLMGVKNTHNTSYEINIKTKIIYDNAFMGCVNVENLIIPEGVTCIGNNAFRDCSSLESVTIPSSVLTIGYAAFYSCSRLKSITIPDGVTRIDNSTFYDCRSLESVIIPNSIISIGWRAFEYCWSLKNITIPESVSYIESWAFQLCGLENAIFEKASGWIASDSYKFSEEDLSNPEIAARYLSDTYCSVYWKKETV